MIVVDDEVIGGVTYSYDVVMISFTLDDMVELFDKKSTISW